MELDLEVAFIGKVEANIGEELPRQIYADRLEDECNPESTYLRDGTLAGWERQQLLAFLRRNRLKQLYDRQHNAWKVNAGKKKFVPLSDMDIDGIPVHEANGGRWNYRLQVKVLRLNQPSERAIQLTLTRYEITHSPYSTGEIWRRGEPEEIDRHIIYAGVTVPEESLPW